MKECKVKEHNIAMLNAEQVQALINAELEGGWRLVKMIPHGLEMMMVFERNKPGVLAKLAGQVKHAE